MISRSDPSHMRAQPQPRREFSIYIPKRKLQLPDLHRAGRGRTDSSPFVGRRLMLLCAALELCWKEGWSAIVHAVLEILGSGAIAVDAVKDREQLEYRQRYIYQQNASHDESSYVPSFAMLTFSAQYSIQKNYARKCIFASPSLFLVVDCAVLRLYMCISGLFAVVPSNFVITSPLPEPRRERDRTTQAGR